MISHHPPNQNQPIDSDKFAFLNLRVLPGKVDYRRAGYILDFEPVAIQKLVAMGYLKPLGNNGGTEHKYFSTQTIMQCAHDPKWMDRAVKALQNHWAEKNSRRKALNPSPCSSKVQPAGCDCSVRLRPAPQTRSDLQTNCPP